MPLTRKSPISETRLRFPRQDRIKKRDEIGKVFKEGRRLSTEGAKLLYLPNGKEHSRFVVTFARKFGNAVRRNRARRLCREAYRHIRGNVAPGFDLVMLVYPLSREKERLAERASEMAALVQRARLLTRTGEEVRLTDGLCLKGLQHSGSQAESKGRGRNRGRDQGNQQDHESRGKGSSTKEHMQ